MQRRNEPSTVPVLMPDGRGPRLDNPSAPACISLWVNGDIRQVEEFTVSHAYLVFYTFFSINSHMRKERGKGRAMETLLDLWYTPMIFITVNSRSLGIPEDGP